MPSTIALYWNCLQSSFFFKFCFLCVSARANRKGRYGLEGTGERRPKGAHVPLARICSRLKPTPTARAFLSTKYFEREIDCKQSVFWSRKWRWYSFCFVETVYFQNSIPANKRTQLLREVHVTEHQGWIPIVTFGKLTRFQLLLIEI